MDTKDLVTILRNAFINQRKENPRLDNYVMVRITDEECKIFYHDVETGGKTWSVMIRET